MPDEPLDAAPARDLPAEEAPASPPVTRARPATATPRKAPAKRAPAKRVPAKRAPAKRAAAPAPSPASGPGSGPWPVRASPAPPPKPVRPAPVPPPAPAPVAPSADATPPTPPPPRRDAVVRFLMTLAVLLLAAAAGLAAAAVVEHRETRYQADTLVRLLPGLQPTDPATVEVGLGVHRYAAVAASSGFRQDTARQAHLPVTALKAVHATPVGGDTLRLTVSAASARRARALATGAGEALVETVNLTEAADQPAAGDRLGATVLAGPTAVTRTAAAPRDAWLAALLAAGAVLALAGVGALLSSLRRR